jgi:hypothetical protein
VGAISTLLAKKTCEKSRSILAFVCKNPYNGIKVVKSGEEWCKSPFNSHFCEAKGGDRNALDRGILA